MTGQLLRTTVYTRINGVQHVQTSDGVALPLQGSAYTSLVLQKSVGASGGPIPSSKGPDEPATSR